MKRDRENISILLLSIFLFIVVGLTACSGRSIERGSQGATMGAVAGAAGGVVSALVFGGNVGDAAARGAVWGGTTGAVSGAVVGSQENKNEKAQQDKTIEKLKTDLGEDAFKGLAALAECKHDVALGYAKTAGKSENKNYALAGLWVEVLTLADQKAEDRARALFLDLITKDSKVSSEAQAEEGMRGALQKIMDIRAEYKLPKTCS